MGGLFIALFLLLLLLLAIWLTLIYFYIFVLFCYLHIFDISSLSIHTNRILLFFFIFLLFRLLFSIIIHYYYVYCWCWCCVCVCGFIPLFLLLYCFLFAFDITITYNNNSFSVVASPMSYSFRGRHSQTHRSHWFDLWLMPLWRDNPMLVLVLFLWVIDVQKVKNFMSSLKFVYINGGGRKYWIVVPSAESTSLWLSKSSLLATSRIGAGWLPFTRLIVFFIFDISCKVKWSND